MDKFDAELMRQQIISFIKMAEIIDTLTTEEIGLCDGYSTVATKKMVEDGTEAIKKIKLKIREYLK